jgi:hypothetical protein
VTEAQQEDAAKKSRRYPHRGKADLPVLPTMTADSPHYCNAAASDG